MAGGGAVRRQPPLRRPVPGAVAVRGGGRGAGQPRHLDRRPVRRAHRGAASPHRDHRGPGWDRRRGRRRRRRTVPARPRAAADRRGGAGPGSHPVAGRGPVRRGRAGHPLLVLLPPRFSPTSSCSPRRWRPATSPWSRSSRCASTCRPSRRPPRCCAAWSNADGGRADRAAPSHPAVGLAIWTRLPQVSSRTAVVTSPMSSGSWVNRTPRSDRRWCSAATSSTVNMVTGMPSATSASL